MYSSSPLCAAIRASNVPDKITGISLLIRVPPTAADLGDVALSAKRVLVGVPTRVCHLSSGKSVLACVSYSEHGQAMGLTISNLFARLFSKKQMRILMGKFLGFVVSRQ